MAWTIWLWIIGGFIVFGGALWARHHFDEPSKPLKAVGENA
jgi:hypothetical protein